MARDHARIKVNIWGDEDFKELRAPQQHAYFMLTTQARLSYAGVLDYIPSRLARLAKGLTEAAVETMIEGLEKARYVVVDHDTQELLVRSYVRHDGLLESPNVSKAMAKDYGEVISPRIRAAILVELQRAHRDDPGMSGWKGIKDKFPGLWEAITKPVADPYANPSPNPYGKGSDDPPGDPSDEGYEDPYENP
jgi:hypothetical protein